jgi:hypothetical protein
MLISSMDVMGINMVVRSLTIRISPGSLPNQLKNQGAKCNIVPMTININPAVIIQRPIITFGPIMNKALKVDDYLSGEESI